MLKHKPIHPIFNNRWSPVIEFATDSLLFMLFGIAGVVLSVLSDCVVKVFQGKDSR
ncbi:hypothetical protein J4G08_16080 [Candidatus Poribacteria bacterium]|nr:hypothetical protein [Candidatus Poribacteria bacterium]